MNYGEVLCPGSSEIFEDLNIVLGQPVEVKIPLLIIEPARSTLKERAWKLGWLWPPGVLSLERDAKEL